MRVATMRPLIYIIYFELVLISHASPQVKANDKGNSVDPPTILMSNQQYHFVPLGSFFQYSIASWEEGYNGKFLSKITIAYSAQILSSSPSYNFIVLQSTSSDSPAAYQQFNCYVRAVNEGIGSLMNNCGFNQNAYIAPNGRCKQTINSASQNMFANINTFMNCTDLQFNYSVVLDQEGSQSNSGTMLFLIDNSGLVFNQTQPVNWINLILSFEVITDINEEDKATLYLLCGLTGMVIAMMIVIAIVLKCKIHRLEKQMQQCKKDKED